MHITFCHVPLPRTWPYGHIEARDWLANEVCKFSHGLLELFYSMCQFGPLGRRHWDKFRVRKHCWESGTEIGEKAKLSWESPRRWYRSNTSEKRGDKKQNRAEQISDPDANLAKIRSTLCASLKQISPIKGVFHGPGFARP